MISAATRYWIVLTPGHWSHWNFACGVPCYKTCICRSAAKIAFQMQTLSRLVFCVIRDIVQARDCQSFGGIWCLHFQDMRVICVGTFIFRLYVRASDMVTMVIPPAFIRLHPTFMIHSVYLNS